MSKNSTEILGTENIPKLLIQQAVPASIGILVMSLNILIDTIFVGQWIGSDAIAAINVVLPVSFFIAALGMSIGIGGASIISRSLGEKNQLKAENTFGNQITLTFIITIAVVIVGLAFVDQIIPVFGGKGSLFEIAKTYYVIVLYGVPVLAFCMMSNNTIRAEGKPKNALYAMMIPSVTNLLLDYIFTFLGSVTLTRQAMVSITVLLVNNILFSFGGESSIAVYAILSRMLMFATFPILGITQGFLPIAGFNYGAKSWIRVRKAINISIGYATLLASLIFAVIFFFAESIPNVFSDNQYVANRAPIALRYVFVALPIVGIQLIGAAYFQAIGKALPALLLTLSRQGIFFIPLLFILPRFYGVDGVWMAFPIADVLSTIVTGFFLNREVSKLKTT